MKTDTGLPHDRSHPYGTILVVDDKQENIRLLFETLQAAGYRTLAAVNGQGAVRQAKLARPDLILLDVMMPGMDGFTTCRQLKQQAETRTIPVLFMTALSETVDKIRGFAAGGVDYLTKPLQHEEVLARINAHLGRHRLWQDIDTYSRILLHLGTADSLASAWSALAALLPANDLSGLALWKPSGTGDELQLACSCGFPQGSPATWQGVAGDAYSRVSTDDTLLGATFRHKQQIAIPDTATTTIQALQWDAAKGVRCCIASPVFCQDQNYGVLLACFSFPHIERFDEHRHWQRILAQSLGNVLFQVDAMKAIHNLSQQLQTENDGLRAEIAGQEGPDGVIGRSPAFRRILSQADLVAPTDAAVLILGETGTGKELLAQYLHRRSQRATAPLIRVNCAAIPSELFESEFFGHVKGAFTGATKDRVGRFALADGGTLFLDEVGEIPLPLQGKLLRVLQEGTFERVGDETPRRTNVRIVAATNRNLHEIVQKGHFREDLFYRLSVFPLTLPPLRERTEDIPELARYLAAGTARKMGCPVPVLPDDLFSAWKQYDWPGNIRELQNELERAMILANGKPRTLPTPHTPSAIVSPFPADRVLPETEWLRLQRHNLLLALQQTRGRVDGPGGAAEQLGLRPTTLRSRIKAFQISKAEIFTPPHRG